MSESKYYTKYPYIYEKEIGGIIGETPTTGELGVSDKGTPSQSGENKDNTKITVMQTYWERYMQPSDFLDTNENVSYYDLFIIDDETHYYISSRYVEIVLLEEIMIGVNLGFEDYMEEQLEEQEYILHFLGVIIQLHLDQL